MIRVYLDPACDVLYASYYIKGFEEMYGRKSIKYDNKFFKVFKQNDTFLAAVIQSCDVQKRIIIDFADSETIHDQAYSWCESYFKINVKESTFQNKKKLIAIGPSFGIHLYSFPMAVYYALLNFSKAKKRISNKRRFFSNYKAQFIRPKLSDYYPNTEKANYIYFIGSIWKKERATNENRANFIKACLSLGVDFEGGFAPRIINDVKGYESITLKKYASYKTYVTKTKRSMVVFNTPAVLQCHGWKLGEFLCFGKPILSTAISRMLPKSLIDGQHVLFTDGTRTDIEKKIGVILRDKNLRNRLSKNARDYFETELAPKQIIKKVIATINQYD